MHKSQVNLFLADNNIFLIFTNKAHFNMSNLNILWDLYEDHVFVISMGIPDLFLAYSFLEAGVLLQGKLRKNFSELLV